MANYDYDLIVIGAGSGGVRASRISASHGARVAVIEEDRPGGTCVIRGCVPKKLLVYGASFAHEASDAQGFGWHIEGLSHSWSSLIAAKDAEINRLEGIYRRLLETAGVDLIAGSATLSGPHEVSVGGKTLTAKTILVAVGGTPTILDIPGMMDYAISSNEALDLEELPETIIIHGGGYIALEFAGIFAALGCKTHLIYRSNYPLRGFDENVREHIAKCLPGRGITLHPETSITKVEKTQTLLEISLDNGTMITANQLLSATGRKPNTASLGLGEIGVEMGEAGQIKVTEDSQTTVPSIYAIGDVTDRVNLTPVALGEGHAFADSLYGNRPRKMSYDMIASAVFSQPPISCVGMTESEATDKGIDVVVFESRFRAMKNTISGRSEQSYMKLVVDQKTDRVLGAHMVGPDCAEIMQGIAIAMKMGATKSDFDATVGIHPTAAEEFVTMRTPRS
tara:strand:- start:193 stop:1548 length:1356 start_codon:yes stop_codon:yes gene_type:complete